MSKAAMHRRVRGGRWEAIFAGVYRLAGSPSSWRQQLLGACLACGGLVSHRAAARLWCMPGFTEEPLELSVLDRRERALPSVIIHRPRALPRTHRTTRDRIPITTPARTLIDLASVVPIDAVEEALDDALRRRVTSIPVIERDLGALARNGRRGSTGVRELLRARSPLDPVTESVFETRLLREIRRARLPEPRRQFQIRDAHGFLARVDFAFPEVKLAIEADGFEHHHGRVHFDRDRARLNRLVALGWRIVHVTWTQLEGVPDAVMEQIRRAREAAR